MNMWELYSAEALTEKEARTHLELWAVEMLPPGVSAIKITTPSTKFIWIVERTEDFPQFDLFHINGATFSMMAKRGVSRGLTVWQGTLKGKGGQDGLHADRARGVVTKAISRADGNRG